MAKYVLREPFAIHLEWFESQGEGKKKVKREQSYFYGPNAIELKNEDAIAHLHKLEPADDAARKLFGDIHDKQNAARESRQAKDGNAKSLAAQVSEAVVGALIAAGVIKAKTA